MNNLYELRKEIEVMKEKLQMIVSLKSYDDIIKISRANKVDEKLMDALSDLEEALVEFNKVRNGLAELDE